MDWGVAWPPLGAAAVSSGFMYLIHKRGRKDVKADSNDAAAITERTQLLLNWNTLVLSQQAQIDDLQTQAKTDGLRIATLEQSNRECERRSAACDRTVKRLSARISKLEDRNNRRG
jgi:hypothetical protein